MFHWICPECGREISPTVLECSACDPKAVQLETAKATDPVSIPQLVSKTPDAAPVETPKWEVVRPSPAEGRARVIPRLPEAPAAMTDVEAPAFAVPSAAQSFKKNEVP